jgi:hypothetical protein
MLLRVNDANRLTINTHGLLGLGAEPANNVMMTISSNGSGSNQPGIKFIDTNSGNDHQIYTNAGNLYFRDTTRGTTTVVIKADGKVGIGTTDPAATLHVKGTASTTNDLINALNVEAATTGTAANGVGTKMTFWGSMSGQNNVELGQIGFHNNNVSGASGDFVIKTRPNGTSAERMRIKSNGNIGIGETEPIRKFVIVGPSGNGSTLLMHMDADTAGGECGIEFKADSTNDNRRVKAAIKFRRDDPGTRGTGNLHFCINGDNNDVNVSTGHSRMHLNSTGRLIINRSSANSDNQVELNHAGASQYGMYINSTSGGSGTQYHMSWARGDTQCGYMTSSATTIGLNNASDERLKENIQNSASATQSIKNIKVRQFDWKNNRDVHKDYGFVAQELVTVVPEAVAVGSEELNEDGTPVQMWGVDDSKLIPRLVKTIQELEARITALEG